MFPLAFVKTIVSVNKFWILGDLLAAAYVLETQGADMCMVGKGEVAKGPTMLGQRRLSKVKVPSQTSGQ